MKEERLGSVMVSGILENHHKAVFVLGGCRSCRKMGAMHCGATALSLGTAPRTRSPAATLRGWASIRSPAWQDPRRVASSCSAVKGARVWDAAQGARCWKDPRCTPQVANEL